MEQYFILFLLCSLSFIVGYRRGELAQLKVQAFIVEAAVEQYKKEYIKNMHDRMNKFSTVISDAYKNRGITKIKED